jgi:hypothetical protein
MKATDMKSAKPHTAAPAATISYLSHLECMKEMETYTIVRCAKVARTWKTWRTITALPPHLEIAERIFALKDKNKT